ncbi:MAG: ATP-binding protein [Deltaproteobacteria bacterium]|nr:ATP-binding protein [Deltaproteobacteria bacterium]
MKEQEKITALSGLASNGLTPDPGEKDGPIEELKKELTFLKNKLSESKKREAELEDTRRAMLYMMEDLNESQKAIIHIKEEWVKTFDGIWDPIFIHDRDCRIVRANKAFQDEAGISYDDMIGRKYWEVFPVMKEPVTMCSLSKGNPLPGKEELTDPASGKIFRVRCYVVDERGLSSALFVHVMEDITEMKGVQELLVQSAKLASIGELAANVAHEINNPMTAVLGYASLILEDLDENSSVYTDLKVIEKESYRIKGIIRNLLDFSRQRKINKKASNINAIIKESIALISHMATTSNILIELNLEEKLPLVEVDENQMKQVFLNLMGNAVHAMDDGGELKIKTEVLCDKANKNVLISFKDNGCGIPKAFVDKVFDPFFSSKGEAGTGLGLSVSYGIVKNHGGRLTLKSEEGKGSEFSVLLPVKHREQGP